LPIILFNNTGEQSYYWGIFTAYGLFIVSSFLLDIIFRSTKSLFITAAMRGIIVSSGWSYFVGGNLLFNGFNGLVGLISLTILVLLIYLFRNNWLSSPQLISFAMI